MVYKNYSSSKPSTVSSASNNPPFLSSSSRSISYNNKIKYGLCLTCDRPNTHSEWCQPCNSERFRKNFKNWTSGNELIDNFIKDSQLSASNNRQVLEWIPYDQFQNFKFVARGGFAKVYSAVWNNGFINKWNHEKNDWERLSKWRVALKTMHDSSKLSSDFFDEIKACVQCGGGFGIIRCYGISRDPDTGNFIIVLYYAHRGNLRTYLEKNYGKLDWIQKLGILKQIAEGLKKIHHAGFVHRDFHSGNILQGKNAEIADLGFTGPADKKSTSTSNNAIYGVLPYVSPEVLRGRKYTSASDIYSFGIIMWEVSECIPPFSDRAHDGYLALDICCGLRPKSEVYVPKPFIKLMNRCWNATPTNRPSAYELYETFQKWYWDLKDGKKNDVTEAFNAVDHDYSQLSSPASSRPVTVTHPLAVYTSRLLSFPGLPEPVNAPPTPRRTISITSTFKCKSFFHKFVKSFINI
ncbi:kinase-like domain-containing protein [Glomus cerebriforme]|uniref:Kinase-like domain-containing protein n=1 Tax=Glomus cerebriforme TaxID=658196 RepID=A0A397T2Y5_9GLOM|nr:kinase-like domain-containing protein [Glomus cerebriforme]